MTWTLFYHKGKFNSKKASRVRVISTNVPNSFFNFKKNIFKNSLNYLTKFNNFALILVKGSNQNTNSHENNNVLRYYGVGAQIIKELKIKKMILVSRSKKKRVIGLRGYNIKINKQEIIKWKKFCIVFSTYNKDITSKLYLDAKKELKKRKFKKIDFVEVPGAFEIPVVISKLISKYDGFIAIVYHKRRN